jgi:heat shock protein HslJ
MNRRFSGRNRFSTTLLKLTALLISLVFVLSACQEEAPQPIPEVVIPTEQLYKNPWVLLAYGDPANAILVPKNTTISIVFEPDGLLSGNSGCNQYSTSFSAQPDGTISIQDEIMTTMMVCPQTQMDLEKAYLGVLPTVTGFNFTSEGRLLLTYKTAEGDQAELVFGVGQVPLENTNWVLSSFGDPSIPQRLSPGVTITAVFTTDGRVTGNSGCNSYSAGYTRQDNTITIGPPVTTKMNCPDAMDIEDEFLTALTYASSYQIVGPNLAITTVDGQVMNFTSSSLPLETTLWSLVSLDNQPVPSDVEITAYFQPDPEKIAKETSSGKLAGTAGCNQYSADYQFSGEEVTIAAPMMTRMICEESIMSVENQFIIIIEGNHAVSIQGDNLELRSEDGTAIFSASRTPLTGALWVLEVLGDIEQPQFPVEGSNFTIQFNRSPSAPTGVASGTTGCNEYASSFTASLTEIKVNQPVTTGNTSCVPGLIDQEQLFFLALNDAAEYRILGDKLVIPYDDNRQSLVFTATQVGFDTNIPLSSLDNTEWFLWTINAQPIMNGTTITARFSVAGEQSGEMSGSSGCNLYSAVFGPGLSIETTINSNTICSLPEGVMDQERTYLEIVSRAFGYWLTADQFILNSGSGTLTYRQSPAPQSADQGYLLQANDWFLVSYNDRLSTSGSNGDPFVRFNRDNTLNGYSGCNDFRGSYSTQLNTLTTGDVVTTLAACPNAVLADQERIMLEVLQTAATFQVFESALQIVSNQGVLNFSNTPVNVQGEPRPPNAVIIAPSIAQAGQSIRFDASRSTADVAITRYQWDFGDRGRGEGKIIEHKYKNPGNYFVQMTVTDQRGYRGSDSFTIQIIAKGEPQPTPTAEQPTPTQQTPTETPIVPTVTPEPPDSTPQEPTEPQETPKLTPTEPVIQVPPSASISGPTQGFPGEPVQFDASLSQPGSSLITSYQWDFGDGSTTPPQTQPIASTIYIHGGTYDVNVTVTDENGQSATASTIIVIQARLDAAVWSLDTLGQVRLIPGTVITLQFLNGTISGFSGCNTYTGSYSASQNENGSYQVQVNNITQTMLGCANEIMQQETMYIEFLTGVQIARINQNQLELESPGGFLVYHEVGAPQPR